MNELKDLLRESNFFARAVTLAMIPIFFKIFLFVGKWWANGIIDGNAKFFGIAGILFGSFIGHQLYYHWIFPEKCKTN